MPGKIGRIVFFGVLAILLLVVLFRSYVTVDAGERAIVANKITHSLRVTPAEGFYFLVPLVESATKYDVRVRTFTMSTATYEGEIKGDEPLVANTFDLQQITLDLSLRFQPDPKQLAQLHVTSGRDFVNRVIRPISRAVIREVISRHTVEEVYTTSRARIQDEIRSQLKAKFAADYIVLTDFLLRDVQLSKETQAAFSAKRSTELELERMKGVLETQRMEKERKLIEAQAEAEALRLKGAALRESPQLVQYEYVKLLAPNVQAIVTDHESLFNFADFLKKSTNKK